MKDNKPIDVLPTLPNQNVADAVPSEQNGTFPEIIDLHFTPIQVHEMNEKKPAENWKLIKSVPFGTFRGKAVTLNIFQEQSQQDSLLYPILRGSIQIMGKSYIIPDQLSNQLLQEQGENNLSIYLLERHFPKERSVYILGSLELFANGPGRMAYLVYDNLNEKWMTFEEWGIPSFLDLNSDGEDEFVIEFPGLHLLPPNITLLTWSQEKKLTAARVITDSLIQDNWIFAKINRDSSPPLISIGSMGNQDTVFHHYRYEGKRLVKFDLKKKEAFQ